MCNNWIAEYQKQVVSEGKRKFRLYEHPWLSLLAVMVTTVFSIGISGTVIFGLLGLPGTSPAVQFAQGMSYHILVAFILVPFVLRLPKENRVGGVESNETRVLAASIPSQTDIAQTNLCSSS